MVTLEEYLKLSDSQKKKVNKDDLKHIIDVQLSVANITSDDEYTTCDVYERDIRDILKESMEKERNMKEDYILLLKEMIDNLKMENMHKNEHISLLLDLLQNNVNNDKSHVENPVETTPDVSCHVPYTNCQTNQTNQFNCNTRETTKHNNEVPRHLNNTSLNYTNQHDETNDFQIDKRWIGKSKKNDDNDIQLYNKFTPLSFQNVVDDNDNNNKNTNDEHSALSVDANNLQIKEHCNNSRINLFTNNYPENDIISYGRSTVVPGNSQYNDLTSKGKKVCILSDSICKRIKLTNLNRCLHHKNAYKKCFSGMGTKEIQHCAKHTLQYDKPDVVILNTGHNDIRNYKPDIIAEEIINLAALCKT